MVLMAKAKIYLQNKIGIWQICQIVYLLKTDNKEEENEIMLSTVLYGLMSNNQNYDINKNFMSNSYHNEASKEAKNDLSEVKSSYFGQIYKFLENLDKS